MRRYYALIAAAVVALDQWSKWLVAHRLSADSVIPVIPGLFNIIYTRNTGVAFGMLSQSSSTLKIAALIAFSAVVIGVVALGLWSERAPHFTVHGLALALVLGGAVGNLIDRVSSGSVVDFLDFYFRNYHWHTFNIADSAIVVGALLWAITLWIPGEARKSAH